MELVRKPATASSNGGELDNTSTQTIPGNKTFTGVTKIKGRTDGTPADAGDIGEIIASGLLFTTALSNGSDTDITGSVIALTPGNWELYYSVAAVFTTGSSAGDGGSIFVKVTDASNNLVAKSSSTMFTRTPVAASMLSTQTLSKCTPLTVTANTSYKLRAQYTNNQGTNSGSIQSNPAGQGEGQFYAKRIS